ncbi:MAG: MopE-related protein [Pseudomonadota bacterium]
MHLPRPGTLILALLPLSGVSLVSCTEETVERYDYPRLQLSAEVVEFGTVEEGGSTSRTIWVSNQGDLPMGLTGLSLGTKDKSANFNVTWDTGLMECPDDGGPEDTGETTAKSAAKGFLTDSGGGDDTEAPVDDTGSEEPETDALAILESGCRMPVEVHFIPQALGPLWGSLYVETGNEHRAEGATGEAAYYADPSHARRLVYLEGEGSRGIPNIVVSPRRHDFGHLWTGSSERAFISIRNAGNGDLTLTAEPYLNGCADTFEITALGEQGANAVVPAGMSTFVEVTYTPEETSAASCEMVIESDDPDSPSIDVDFEANTGTDPGNEPPTVIIRSPGIGYQFSGGESDSLRMELNLFDVNQPADSLICRVKSMVVGDGTSVAHCEADDESGHVFVDVPFENVDNGVDTVKVQVTDASQILAYASISVLWNEAYPDSDDDGDGWGDESDADENGNFDCDDLDIHCYPYAADINDGKDNDCDGIADEGTRGYDDDGDSFSEDEGDCNDYDDTIYPGAWELADYKDNDCDAVIDETTSLYDDDGDGYTEMDLDCDDDSVDVHPGALEYCDGIDNDCNGLRDYSDGCIELNSEPYIVGGIRMQQTACEPGDTIAVSVMAYDADGQALDYAWTGDESLSVEPLTGSPSVTVTCPDPGPDGKIYSLYVVVTDEDGNAVWDFDDMSVYDTNKLYVQYIKRITSQRSCASGGGLAPALSLTWLALIGAAIRRRRSS